MDIKSEVRKILKEVVSEAVPTTHFKDRIYTRLTSDSYTTPEFNYNSVKESIELVKKINFPKDTSFAVKLKKFPITFRSVDPYSQKASEGDELWMTIRENDITTIFFRNSSQQSSISNIDHMININSLKRYYDKVQKNEDGTVDLNVNRLLNPKGSGSRKRPQLDLPSVDLGGAKWFIDEENEQLIYAKNIKKKVDFDDLKEDVLEKIITAIVS